MKNDLYRQAHHIVLGEWHIKKTKIQKIVAAFKHIAIIVMCLLQEVDSRKFITRMAGLKWKILQ